jgi:hypothetical protein
VPREASEVGGLDRGGAKWCCTHAPSAGGARAGRHAAGSGLGVREALARVPAVGPRADAAWPGPTLR